MSVITEIELLSYPLLKIEDETEIRAFLNDVTINDFEDAMQCASAMACNADVIVSHNIKDYQNSPIRTLTPEQFLQKLRS